MTKLDYVARAIADYWIEHGFDPSEPSEGAARAAVEALRDSYDHHGDPTGFIDMIDAILNEKPE